LAHFEIVTAGAIDEALRCPSRLPFPRPSSESFIMAVATSEIPRRPQNVRATSKSLATGLSLLKL
jgi:hypothetical protein